MKYYNQQEGEWLEPPRGYKMACCDCGLIHRMEFRVVKGRVQFRAWRDNRATAQRRRNRPHAELVRWLRKFDAVQKRTAKSTLQLGSVQSGGGGR